MLFRSYMDLEEDRMEASVLEFFQRNISDTPACRNIKPIQLYIEDKLYATDSPENIKKQMISAAKYSLGETIAQQITKEDRSMLEEMDEVEVCMEEASEIAEE